jgi:putative colanic acid biosynthesis UDP-glucose lipid carrier transferase
MIKQANTVLVVLVSFLVAYWIRWGYSALPVGYLVALLVTLLLSAVIFPATGAFRREFAWASMRKIRRLIAGWAIVILVLVSIAAMLKVTDYYSRIWFGTFVLLGAAGLVLLAMITHGAAVSARRSGRDRRKIVLVGSGDIAMDLHQRLQHDPYPLMQLMDCFGEEWGEQQVQPISSLRAYIADQSITEVWIAVPSERKDLLEQTLNELKESVVDINVVPDLHQYRLLNQNISEWSGLPVISLAGTPMTDAELRLKTVMDWFGALILALLLMPLFLVLALAILINDGAPVFYRQKRQGIGGDYLNAFKFRTMKSTSGGDGFRQAAPDDNRVTAVGRFLRKTSLDELPQLFNVIKGEMSLVGPRPHPIELNDEFKSRIPKYMLRHKVKPGITGWAQVNGFRGQTDTPEKMAARIEHDLWYIQNWSLWLDLKILLMTPFVMIHRNAY